ncbi:MAG: hypothetical protein MUE77_07180 [Sandarakinorhabdus sp.]|jgi:hypothetical protein|nr:hypothetical protein [Sandarakinorhabdus sp.]
MNMLAFSLLLAVVLGALAWIFHAQRPAEFDQDDRPSFVILCLAAELVVLPSIAVVRHALRPIGEAGTFAGTVIGVAIGITIYRLALPSLRALLGRVLGR